VSLREVPVEVAAPAMLQDEVRRNDDEEVEDGDAEQYDQDI